MALDRSTPYTASVIWGHTAGAVTIPDYEVSTMSHAKQSSKRKGQAKSAVLGVAGALSLAGGASGAAVGPAGNTPTEHTASVIIGEEEISDVSLATFYVFDNENAAAHRPVLRLAQRTRSRPRQGCGGCAGDCGGGGPTKLRKLRKRRRAGWELGKAGPFFFGPPASEFDTLLGSVYLAVMSLRERSRGPGLALNELTPRYYLAPAS